MLLELDRGDLLHASISLLRALPCFAFCWIQPFYPLWHLKLFPKALFSVFQLQHAFYRLQIPFGQFASPLANFSPGLEDLVLVVLIAVFHPF